MPRRRKCIFPNLETGSKQDYQDAERITTFRSSCFMKRFVSQTSIIRDFTEALANELPTVALNQPKESILWIRTDLAQKSSLLFFSKHPASLCFWKDFGYYAARFS